jgi:uncharacterized membrane protein YbhN (UPF0104 family)
MDLLPLPADRAGGKASRLPRWLWSGIRLAITGGLLGLLLSRVDIGHAAALLAGSAPATVVGSALAMIAATPLNAERWRILCEAGTRLPSPLTFWKILLVGLFFNQVLPSGVGGDAVRAWRCHKLGIPLGAAIRSLLLDRAAGYSVYVALLAAGLPMLASRIGSAETHGLVLVLALCLSGLVALFVLDRVPGIGRLWTPIASLGELSVAARRVAADPRRLLSSLALSACSVGITVLAYRLAGGAVGIGTGYGVWLALAGPVTLLQLVPISLAGWGVREVALVHLLGAFAVPAEQALAAAILVGLLQIVVALPGGLVWLGGWDLPRPSAGKSGGDRR